MSGLFPTYPLSLFTLRKQALFLSAPETLHDMFIFITRTSPSAPGAHAVCAEMNEMIFQGAGVMHQGLADI